MSALDRMIETVVRTAVASMGEDVDVLKQRCVDGIAEFQKNVQTVNDMLVAHDQKLARIEAALARIEGYHPAIPSVAIEQKDTADVSH